MMDKNWTPIDAQVLKELRTAAGLDRANFARRCTLSLAQLVELEEGGSGRFYSERIKAYTGETLMARLGHRREPPVAEPVHEVPPAPSPAQVSEPADRRGSAANAKAGAGTTPPASDASAPASVPPMAFDKATQTATPAAATFVAAADTPPPKRSSPWLATTLVLLLAIGLLAWLNRPKPIQAGLAASPSMPAEPATAEASPAGTGAGAGNVTESEPVAVAPPQRVSSTAPRCEALTGAPATFSPVRPLKPATYVYLEASQPVTVCVTDGQQRHYLAQVQPGDGVTVTGQAPFTLQAPKWVGVRVFFQGVRVPLEDPSLGASALLLQAR